MRPWLWNSETYHLVENAPDVTSFDSLKEDDEQDDRQVKEGKAEHDRGDVEAAPWWCSFVLLLGAHLGC
jgi:hypothetical protein